MVGARATGNASALPLDRIADIRNGDPAGLGRLVRVEGVVTYVDRVWSLLFVQDDEQGIFVKMAGQPIDVTVGDRVQVVGRGAPGDFAPIIDGPGVTRLGPGVMPVPARPVFEELLTGDWDSQLIELDGIVRGIYPIGELKDQHLMFDVAVGTWRVLAQLPERWTGPVPEQLVDTRVRIRGVGGTMFNTQRQLVGLQLFIPSMEMVRPLDAPRPEAFSAPVQPIRSLNRWASRHGLGRRVRVRGEVTWANGRQVYVRDSSGSIAATLWTAATLAAGQQVDIAGFVAVGTYSPTLEDAVVRPVAGLVEPAAAISVSAAELLSGLHDGGLVTLEAQVVSQGPAPDQRLVLKVGDVVFAAQGPATGALDVFEPGTLLSVTGVCRIQVDPLDSPRVPRGFQLLLRTPEDVRLVRPAAWSPRRTLQAMSLLFAMVLAGLAWIVSLRSRVAQQTQALREQLDRERALEARYRDLVAAANDMVVTCDADGRVTSINGAGQRLTGQAAESAVGRPFRELVPPAERPRLDREMAASVAHRTGATLEVVIERPPAAPCTLELDVRPLFRGSRPAGLQAIGRDVTTRKRAEHQLAVARDAAEAASRAKSEFMANISHEVRTPLNGILGMTELVLAGPLPDEPRQYLHLVRASAEALLHVINDILDFSTIESGHLRLDAEPFDLADRLASTLEPLGVTARRKGLRFDVHLADTLPSVVIGDAGRFGQVLVNLVGNAVKFTETGGVVVTVGTEPPRPGDDPERAVLRVEVADTGIGIPEDKHARIFEAFAQADGSTSRRFGGTGLGLSIASRIVAHMGGTLGLKSTPGEGTVFTLSVPFRRGSVANMPPLSSSSLTARLAAASGADVAPSWGEPTPRPRHVLLVEDNAVNQRVAHEILKRRGHHVTLADNGHDALRLLSEARFDVVLMDVQMPGMNGLEATRAIRASERETGAHIPIVAMTAHAMTGDRQRCLEAGMDEYLTKPIRAEALIRHVEQQAMTLPPATPSAPPAFSLDAALERVDGDRALLAEIAGIFLTDAPAMLADISTAVAAGDADSVSRAAHRLKGSVLTFGAAEAADAACRLEDRGRAGDVTTAPADLDRLAAAVDRLRAALEDVLRGQEKKSA